MRDIELSRSAASLIEEHGDRAIVKAVERYLEFIRNGDRENALIWRRITTAIDRQMQQSPAFRGTDIRPNR